MTGAAQQAGAGVEDELERLWTPHRMAYINDADRRSEGYATPQGCPFCLAPDRGADESLVIARGEHVFAVLNLYA